MTKTIILKTILESLVHPLHGNNIRRLKNFALNASERVINRAKLRSMPLGIDLIATTKCNFKCMYCKKYDWGSEPELSMENFDNIAKIFFPTLLYLKLGSAGEHLLHKDLPYMLKRCHEEGVAVIINSNGSFLTETVMDTLLKYRVAVFGLSLDGATRNTAERIRKGLDFDKLIDRIKTLSRKKKEGGHPYPVLTVNFAAMKSNIHELPDFVRLMADCGVYFIRFIYLYIHDFMDPDESLFLDKPLFQKYLPLALNEAQKQGVRLIAPASLDDSYAPTKCYYPYHEIGLSPDGSVAFCCNAWDEKKMGNVFHQDFKKEIWNSTAYQSLRKTVNSPEPVFRLCLECSALDRGANGFSRHMMEKHHVYARKVLDKGEIRTCSLPDSKDTHPMAAIHPMYKRNNL